MMNQPIIEIEDLTVIYNENTANEIIALDNYSLKIDKGEVLVIRGGNGSGKTTLLNAIAGTIPIKNGIIKIDGIDITKWNPIKRTKYLGFVHQDVMLGTCPNLTITENFQLTNNKKWWAPIPYKRKLTNSQIENIKKIGLPLDSRNNTNISMLSGGQRQAISISLAFENKKPILLFDEVTSSLDKNTLKNVIKFTMSQAKVNHTTMLMVTHHSEIIESITIRDINLDEP